MTETADEVIYLSLRQRTRVNAYHAHAFESSDQLCRELLLLAACTHPDTAVFANTLSRFLNFRDLLLLTDCTPPPRHLSLCPRPLDLFQRLLVTIERNLRTGTAQ